MKADKLWEMYDVKGRVWLSVFDEEFVEDYLDGEVSDELLESAVRQANKWMYQRDSGNWNYGVTTAVEKAMKRDNPERFDARRLAFTRYVLATVASVNPAAVEPLLENVHGK